MNPIVNTADQDPIIHLAEAWGMMAKGAEPGAAIEAQEARGQRQLCSQTQQLPTDIKPGDLLALKTLGFEFLGPVEGDKLFQRVTFPEGWSIKPTDHHMWSDLLDEKGRKRGGIFYKAAFYDRGAHLHLEVRYRASQTNCGDGPWRPCVFDNGTVVSTDEHGGRVFATVWEGESFTPNPVRQTDGHDSGRQCREGRTAGPPRRRAGRQEHRTRPTREALSHSRQLHPGPRRTSEATPGLLERGLMAATEQASPVHLAAYTQALQQLEGALHADTPTTIERVTKALGPAPSLEELHRAYVRVLQGGVL